MKVKNGELVNNLDGLNELAKLKISSGVSYRTARLLEVLSKQAEIYFKIRNQLLQEHALKDEAGQIAKQPGTEFVTIPPEHIAKFVELDAEEGDEVKEFFLSALEQKEGEVRDIVDTPTMLKLGRLVIEG